MRITDWRTGHGLNIGVVILSERRISDIYLSERSQQTEVFRFAQHVSLVIWRWTLSVRRWTFPARLGNEW